MSIVKSTLSLILFYLFVMPCIAEELNCSFHPEYVWPLTEKELEDWQPKEEFQNVRLIRDEEGLHDVILVNRGTKDMMKTLFYDVYDAEMTVGSAKYEGFYDPHRRTYFFTSSFNFSTKILIAKTGEAILAESFGVWEGMCE